jgi:hypothetical protein
MQSFVPGRHCFQHLKRCFPVQAKYSWQEAKLNLNYKIGVGEGTLPLHHLIAHFTPKKI